MKFILSTLAMTLSFAAFNTANAADKKLGNLILVERTLDNVYASCSPQLKIDDKDPVPGSSQFFACNIPLSSGGDDYSPKYQRVLTHSDSTCDIEGFAQNASVLVTVQLKGKVFGVDTAKTCLQRALDASDNKDSFKFKVITLE